MAADTTPGIKSLRRIQLAREATAGTKVKPTTLWRGEGTIKNDQAVISPVEDIGIVIDTDRAYIASKGGTLTLESTPATFEQLPYLGEMGIKSVGTGTADGGGTGKIYTYPLPTTSKNSVATYGIEAGDDRQVQFGQYAFAESFKLSGKYNEAVVMSGVLKTRTVAPLNYTAATISFSTAGTIADSANGFGIFPSTTFQVRARGSSSNDGVWKIATGSTSTLTLSTGTLITEAAGSTVTIEQYFTDVSVPAVTEAIFNKGKLYIDAVGGTIGTTQVSNTFLAFDLDFKTGWKGQATGDGRFDFSFAKVTKPTWTLKITYEHDGNATAEYAKYLAKTPRLIRIKIEGDALGTAGSTYTYKTIIIDIPGIYTDWSALTNDDGNDTVVATLKGGYDTTAALGGQLIVVNELSSLT